jgi:hypothetical protein
MTLVLASSLFIASDAHEHFYHHIPLLDFTLTMQQQPPHQRLHCFEWKINLFKKCISHFDTLIENAKNKHGQQIPIR